MTLEEARSLLGPDAPETDAELEKLQEYVTLLGTLAIDSACSEAAEKAEREAS